MLASLTSFALTFLVRASVAAFERWQADRALMELGRVQAAAEAAHKALQASREARASEAETAARHRADPSDAAFVPAFRRD